MTTKVPTSNVKQINMVIAHHLGFWVYHYDKGPAPTCYYLLVNEEFDAVSMIFGDYMNRGHRDTLDEALNDIPDWHGSTDLALGLLDESDLYYKIEKRGHYEFTVTVGKSKYGQKSTATSDTLPDAICQAYCEYHKIDITKSVELKVS